MTFKIRPALMLLLALLGGCTFRQTAPGSRPEIWATYARNVPHATQQRVDIFLTSEQPAFVVGGFLQQWVTISLHEAANGRLLNQTTQYVESPAGRAVLLKQPLPAGRYLLRASQEGVEKAQHSFTVR
jgi:hypothetical protein